MSRIVMWQAHLYTLVYEEWSTDGDQQETTNCHVGKCAHVSLQTLCRIELHDHDLQQSSQLQIYKQQRSRLRAIDQCFTHFSSSFFRTWNKSNFMLRKDMTGGSRGNCPTYVIRNDKIIYHVIKVIASCKAFSIIFILGGQASAFLVRGWNYDLTCFCIALQSS